MPKLRLFCACECNDPLLQILVLPQWSYHGAIQGLRLVRQPAVSVDLCRCDVEADWPQQDTRTLSPAGVSGATDWRAYGRCLDL